MMDQTPDWNRVKQVLLSALERPPEERAQFARSACDNDAALLAEVQSLLAAYERAGRFGERSALQLLDETQPPVPARSSAETRFAPGQVVGAYRIVTLLGRGGMGDVYEAEHLEHGRRVALKVVNQQLTNIADRGRFLREGQIAASINHPNLVYVYGSEEIDGTAAIVMELVPGGTLKERVIEQGPLTTTAAVEIILQVIAGLEAAHAAGIIHGDVKPGNCFIDSDGTVKVGDFGLSVSPLGPHLTQLTRSGIVVTPQFAAPEQLRGQALDVRTDIYAVGGTLYYLLTGAPPFDDPDLLTLLTRVATEAPRSPRDAVHAIPRGLARIALRCLAKEPAARFPSYAALREALEPFGADAPTAATLTVRVVAGILDVVVVQFGLNVVVGMMRTLGGDFTTGNLWLPGVWGMWLYFALFEGFAGAASPGKRIFGLCLTDTDGGRPSAWKAVVRSAIFTVAVEGPALIPLGPWLRAMTPSGGMNASAVADTAARLQLMVIALRVLAAMGLFITARPQQGFAGVHDLLSGTRVSTRRSKAKTVRLATPAAPQISPIAASPASATRGPFLLRSEASASESTRLWLGFDPLLKREVWIRERPAGSPLSDRERRDLAQPGRLRWLAGRADNDCTWEAFEAPRGTRLRECTLVPRPWGIVRHWLADLAHQLITGHAVGDRPGLSLDHVWITLEGRAILLDFPAPGASPRVSSRVHGAAPGFAAIQAFLDTVASTALGGSEQRVEIRSARRPPLPVSGTSLLRALKEPGTYPEALLALCSRAVRTPSVVPRWSRALLPTVAAVVGLGVTVPIISVSRAFQTPALIGVDTQDRALFNGLVAIERLRKAGVPEADDGRRALEVYLAGRYPLAKRAPSFSGGLRPFRTLALDVAARRTPIAEDDLSGAVQRLGRERLDALNRDALTGETAALVLVAVADMAPVLAGLACASALIAFLLRGGLILWLFRLDLVDDFGHNVTRWRALLRATLGCVPLIALVVLANRTVMTLAVPTVTDSLIVAGLGLTIVAFIGVGIAVPERGVQDRIAGTWLVPR